MKKKCDFIDITDLMGAILSEDSDKRSFEDIVEIDSVANDRNIYISDIDSGIGSTVDSVIRFWNRQDGDLPIEDREPIKMYIDSMGGSLVDAFSVIDAIKMSKTPVWTIVTGTAYSAGFFIAIAGHKRFAYPLASFMYHEGSASNGGTANQFRNFADFYDTQLLQLKNHVLDCTNIDEARYKDIKKDDVWMTATEALEIQAIDEIVGEFV